MVVLAFRQQCDTVHEAPRLVEVAELEAAGDCLATLHQRPAWKPLRQGCALCIGQTFRHQQPPELTEHGAAAQHASGGSLNHNIDRARNRWPTQRRRSAPPFTATSLRASTGCR